MISYSTVQGSLAKRLHGRLMACGCCNPKLDQVDINSGDRWRQTVAWWLSACETAVVLLSEEAIASAWVRYELTVLSNREKLERNMRLVLVYVGVRRDEVNARDEFEPLELGEIQSYHELAGAEVDDDVLDGLADRIHDQHAAGVGEPPIERLVDRVCEEVRHVAPERLTSARNDLPADDDPWLSDVADRRRAFGRAYCSTPLDLTYKALQTLAQDRQLTVEDLAELIDLNVMTTFDSKLIDRLHRAAQGHVRRSMVTATTRADLAEVGTQAVTVVHEALFTYRFVVSGPVMGFTQEDIAEGLAEELRHAIWSAHREEPEVFLAAVARRQHPVFVLLTGVAGMEKKVLGLLEERFPSVVFVVLSSSAVPMPELAAHLGVEGMGMDTDDHTTWAEHVAYERDLATERLDMREDLRRVKQALPR